VDHLHRLVASPHARNAFFLVVGSRTCAHLVQSAPGVMIFRETPFRHRDPSANATCRLGRANEELDGWWATCSERRREIRTLLFLVGFLPSEVISWTWPRRPSHHHTLCAAACGWTFRQRASDNLHPGGGRRLSALVPCSPLRRRPLLLVGTLPMASKTACSPVRAPGSGAGAQPAAAPVTGPAQRRSRHPGCCWPRRSSATPVGP